MDTLLFTLPSNTNIIIAESDDRSKSDGSPRFRPIAKNDSATTGDPVIDSMTLTQLIGRPDYGFALSTSRAYHQRLAALAREEAIKRTDELLRRRHDIAEAKRATRKSIRGIHISAQSLVIEAESDNGDMATGGSSYGKKHENVTDYEGETADVVRVGVPLHDMADGGHTVHQLEQFFARPISIYDDTWNVDGQSHQKLRIWDLWSKSPTIRAKLSNYAYFKGTMHLKISVSSTPYHYGRVMASYHPYPDYNDTLTFYDDALSNYGVYIEQYLTYVSQAPGCRVIDIKENQPLELEIPFISYKQRFRLYNADHFVITNATSFYDFKEAGELRLDCLGDLRCGNADHFGAVSVNVFAWCTDVELGTITGTDIDITAESSVVISAEAGPDAEEEARRKKWNDSMADKPMYSGKGSMGSRIVDSVQKGLDGGGDEYQTPGPVATVATAVSKVGDALSDIPVIGSFAKATSTLASGLGKVASFFGWSKPSVLDKPSFVKNQPFTNGANFAGHDTSQRITCDPKQELTVDPSIGGMQVDELSILSFSSRQSYIGSFDWSNTDVAMTDVLWKAGVSPMLGQRTNAIPISGGGDPCQFQDSALAFVARPFQYWRGNIKFRFDVVCSKFHRGKLLFRFEPNMAQYTTIASSTAQLNQHNSVILDIQDGQTITFECEWAQPRAWCHIPTNAQTGNPFVASQYGNDTPGTVSAYVFDPTLHNPNGFNGIIECRVLNELVQPSSASNVSVHVYAWCDDLQLAVPTDVHLPESRTIDAQSAIVSDETETKLVETRATMEHIHLDHFGEKILSIRSLLKRFQGTHQKILSYVANRTSGYYSFRHDCIPEGLPVKKGVHVYSNQFNARTAFAYFRPAFMGMRGSMKHRITMVGDTDPDTHNYAKVHLGQAGSNVDLAPDLKWIEGNTLTAMTTYGDSPFFSTIRGTVDFHLDSNGGIEFEVPYYSPNLFSFAFNESGGTTVAADSAFGYDPIFPQSFEVLIGATHRGDSAETHYMAIFDATAIGEDFQFFRFQGAPPFEGGP